MYIVILNYESGRVCAFDLSYKPEDMDAEEYTETTLDYVPIKTIRYRR